MFKGAEAVGGYWTGIDFILVKTEINKLIFLK